MLRFFLTILKTDKLACFCANFFSFARPSRIFSRRVSRSSSYVRTSPAI